MQLKNMKRGAASKLENRLLWLPVEPQPEPEPKYAGIKPKL